MQSHDDQWISPSFNTYSQNNLAEIAARVAGEASTESLPIIEESDEEDDFEFSFTLNDEFEVAGEEIISGDKSQPPIFPIFNRGLLQNFELENPEEKIETIQVPLSRLFIEEREDASESSSEADEVESIPPGTYCVWKPKIISPPSPSTCKKSKSTGFGSKRWKIRDLLRRSNSDGKDSFVFLTPKRKDEKFENKNHSKAAKALTRSKKSTTAGEVASTSSSSPNRRMLYSPANRSLIRGNETPNRSPRRNNEIMPKRKSYLPYRQDLVGFFTTVNSLGRNLSPL